jgi:DNA-binding Xre family transcriptional regulator
MQAVIIFAIDYTWELGVEYQKVCAMEGFVNNIPILVAQKCARDGKMYTQTEIAEATGLSQAMVSRMIRYKVQMENLTIGVLDPMATWLGCNVEELYKPRKRAEN